ncbi:hypothetical protein [Streptomyces sp. R41]|uniref:Uncharacterized protein n=1 Tax=Streptomyces sp. R41 TaxID=3238632 RepID=A0AB39RMS5_9ACTN
MATLLHIDWPAFPGEASSSRSVVAAFHKAGEDRDDGDACEGEEHIVGQVCGAVAVRTARSPSATTS